jgi:hypothetical protein
MSEHQWYYEKKNVLGEQQVGPLNEPEFLRHVKLGKVAPHCGVFSETRTKNEWRTLESIPALYQMWHDGEESRNAVKAHSAAEKAEKQRQRQEKQRQRQVAIEQDRAAEAAMDQATAMITDHPDYAYVEHICECCEKLLTANEVIQYVAVQKKPVVTIKPDAIVCTNKRLIFYVVKLLGRFDFFDYQWRDLSDAHISQGLLSSTFTARHVNGTVVKMEHIPKEVATKLYRLAQQREEDALEERRQRKMEETRAGASNITVAGTGPSSAPTDDPLSKLEKLKTMLDRQLISQAEFDAKKAAILESL